MRCSLHLFILLISIHLVLSSLRDQTGRRGIGPKRRCHQCNMPNDCTSGSCVGDVCVKTVAAVATNNVYVSKGCENYTSYSSYPMRYEDNCRQEMVFGVESVICYCSDRDYCNSSLVSSSSIRISSISLLLFLLTR